MSDREPGAAEHRRRCLRPPTPPIEARGRGNGRCDFRGTLETQLGAALGHDHPSPAATFGGQVDEPNRRHPRLCPVTSTMLPLIDQT